MSSLTETKTNRELLEGIIKIWNPLFGTVKAIPEYTPESPADEARYMESPTVADFKPAPIFETGDPAEGFYLGVLPDGSRVPLTAAA